MDKSANVELTYEELDNLAEALNLFIQQNDWRKGYDWDKYRALEDKMISNRNHLEAI